MLVSEEGLRLGRTRFELAVMQGDQSGVLLAEDQGRKVGFLKLGKGCSN